PCRGGPHDLTPGQGDTRPLDVVALVPGAGEPGLDAAALGTVTRWTGPLVGRGPGKRIVPPFAGDQVRAQQHLTVDHDPPADSRAEDDAEHDVRARGRAVGRFGDRETVRIVHESHGAVESRLEIASQG